MHGAMSIARRSAAPWVAALLLVTLLVGSARWQPVARATDPTVNDAISQQTTIANELTRQRSQLADLQREQADLAANLRGMATDIQSVGLQIDQALARLEDLTRKLVSARGELRLYQVDITDLAGNLQNVSAEIDSSTIELSTREALLQDHLRTAYEQSQSSILEVLLSTDSFTKATSQLSYMLTLTDEDRALAAEVRDRRQALEKRRETLSLGRTTLSALRDAAAQRTAALDLQQQQLDAVRVSLEEKQRQLAQLKDARERDFTTTSLSAEQQRQLVAAQELLLAGQKALVDRLKAEANALDIAYRGRFEWPEHGSFLITQEFGPTPYESFHSALDIAYYTPRCGGPIYAAGDGVVLEDGRPLAQYGDTAIGVVIGHSQRLQTYYWHLSREIVSVGQQVHTGDVIGYEGRTGMATGCHLHFAVMFDDSPVNPRLYLP